MTCDPLSNTEHHGEIYLKNMLLYSPVFIHRVFSCWQWRRANNREGKQEPLLLNLSNSQLNYLAVLKRRPPLICSISLAIRVGGANSWIVSARNTLNSIFAGEHFWARTRFRRRYSNCRRFVCIFNRRAHTALVSQVSKVIINGRARQQTQMAAAD